MRIFRHYPEVDMEKLKGYTITDVIVPEDEGFVIEVERDIEGGTLGIDICYDPNEETEITISNEYIKCISKEVPVTSEYHVLKVKKLVLEAKRNYEACLDLCGEDDEVNTLPAKQMYEEAKEIFSTPRTVLIGGKNEQN